MRCDPFCGIGTLAFQHALARSLSMIGRFRIYASLALACAVAFSSLVHAQPRPGGQALISMVICTPEGLVQVALDADGTPVNAGHYCPDCVLPIAALLAAHVVVPDPYSQACDDHSRLCEVWAGGAAGLWSEGRSPPTVV